MNKPFVVLLAALVGLGLGAYVVAAGPPIKEVSTYRVVSQSNGVALNTGSYNTEVRAECGVGDSVTGGGYNVISFRYGLPIQGAIVYALASQPFVNHTSGAEGWKVEFAINYAGGYSVPEDFLPNLVLQMTAVCLHRA